MAFVSLRSVRARPLGSFQFAVVGKNPSRKSHQQSVLGDHDKNEAKPYSSIPTPHGLPLIGSAVDLFRKPYGIENVHKFIENRISQYGCIFKETLAGTDIVFTTNLQDFDIVLQDSEKEFTPKPVWSMEAYYKKRGETMWNYAPDAEEYVQKKKLLFGRLLQPKVIGKSSEYLSDATDDLIKRLREVTTQNSSYLLDDTKVMLQKWIYQSTLALIFRKQFRLLNANPDPFILNSFNNTKHFFEVFTQLELGPLHHRIFSTKLWKLFEELWEKNELDMRELLDKNKQYLVEETLSDRDKMTALIDLPKAALHTTSITAVWCLIELSKRPNVQENIVSEANKVLTNERIAYADLQKLHYTRGVLSEVFRISQTVAFLYRKTVSDLVLSGYHVPGGTKIAMYNLVDQAQYFQNALKMEPERWIRSKNQQECPHQRRMQKLAVLPFGYGKGACSGKRHAENMLYMFLVKMCQNFIIKPINLDIDTQFDFLVAPKGQINFTLEPRNYA